MKVFRTYNASITLENELNKAPTNLVDAPNEEKYLFYNRANREVAILCNHQRTVKESVFSAGMGKLKFAVHVQFLAHALHYQVIGTAARTKSCTTTVSQTFWEKS